MPRSPEDNQQIKDARREAILTAATRVFAKKGFNDAKISDVAKEAGLSHGLVYHYFDNKEAVFHAILEDKLCKSRELIREDESGEGDGLERMRASLSRWLGRVQQDPEMSVVIAQAFVTNELSESTRSMMRDHMREAFETSTRRLAEGQERGEIGKHAPAAELAAAIMCFMRGVAFHSMIEHDVPFPTPSADLLARLLVPDGVIGALQV